MRKTTQWQLPCTWVPNMKKSTVMQSTSSDRHPTVLILAAGSGTRFRASGGSTHKLDALLDGVTVLERSIQAAQQSGLPWHLVRKGEGGAGMGDSIAAAVRATADARGWLVLPGDLPLVLPETLRSIAAALAGTDCAVAMPVYHGERGHPVGFAAECLPGLLALTGEQGAASVVRAQAQQGRVRQVEVDDMGTVTDVDTVQDLERAAQRLAARR